MTATVTIQSSGQQFQVESGETLLEAALRAGLALHYNCNSGSCGKCQARILSGQTDTILHHDFVIPDSQRKQGTVLLCRTTSITDLVIETELDNDPRHIPLQTIATSVYKLEYATGDVMVLHLRTPRSQTLRFLAGQHVTLTLNGIDTRNKSIASCPCNGMIVQFHIRRVPGDKFSEYVFSQLQTKHQVMLSGPDGDFVLDTTSQRPLIFIAYETGFAPLKSLIEHAISLELTQPIHFYWAARHTGSHYLENHCRSWQDALDNFHYTAIVPDGGIDAVAHSGADIPTAEACLMTTAAQVVGDYPDLQGHDVYVSAPASGIAAARELFLRHGLVEDRLFVDVLERL